MKSFVLAAAVMTALAPLSVAARADDMATEKSAPVKGPPNANGGEAQSEHKTPPMKGSPNAAGYDETKGQSGAPK